MHRHGATGNSPLSFRCPGWFGFVRAPFVTYADRVEGNDSRSLFRRSLIDYRLMSFYRGGSMLSTALPDGGPRMKVSLSFSSDLDGFLSFRGTPPAMVMLSNVLGTRVKSSTTLRCFAMVAPTPPTQVLTSPVITIGPGKMQAGSLASEGPRGQGLGSSGSFSTRW